MMMKLEMVINEPVAEDGMKVKNELLLLDGEGAALEIRAQVVDPPKSAALPASLQASIPRDVAPTPLPVPHHVVHQLLVLLRRPQPFPQLATVVVVTATSTTDHKVTARRRGIGRFPHLCSIDISNAGR